MATAHPGKWELILNETLCLKYTEATAANSAVVQNPITKKWHVLYYFGRDYDSSSLLWDPDTGSLTPYTFPPWPGGVYSSQPFCGGLCMQPDGSVIECGGFIDEITYLGSPYTFIFKFDSGPRQDWEWVVPGLPGPPHEMHNGRWYPSIVTLGAGQGFGKYIAMSGYRGLPFPPLVVNDDPEIYDPGTGWAYVSEELAKQPFTAEFDIYVHAFVIPAGPELENYSTPLLTFRLMFLIHFHRVQKNLTGQQ